MHPEYFIGTFLLSIALAGLAVGLDQSLLSPRLQLHRSEARCELIQHRVYVIIHSGMGTKQPSRV